MSLLQKASLRDQMSPVLYNLVEACFAAVLFSGWLQVDKLNVSVHLRHVLCIS